MLLIVRPEPSKIESVKSFPILKTKKQVRAFLGLTGYHRKFIKDDRFTIDRPDSSQTKIEWSLKLEAAPKTEL